MCLCCSLLVNHCFFNFLSCTLARIKNYNSECLLALAMLFTLMASCLVCIRLILVNAFYIVQIVLPGFSIWISDDGSVCGHLLQK
jgi:hypothetical protein